MGKKAKPRAKSRVNGVLLLNKSAGMTSHDCVNKVRQLINQKKVGHFGTLDPFATGVLVLGLGEGTKLSPFLVMDNKEYIAEIKFGANTDTYDLDGEVMEEFDLTTLDHSKIDEAINAYVGKISQMPPKYSAIKVKGKPLYKYARDGEEVDIKSRDVEIFNIENLGFNGVDILKIRVSCSKGTYIRSLAYDIGNKLGVGGHLVSLERTKSGEFNLDQAKTLEDLSYFEDLSEQVLTLDESTSNLTSFAVKEDVGTLIKNGGRVESKELKLKSDQGTDLIKVLCEDKLISIGKIVDILETKVFVSNRVFLS